MYVYPRIAYKLFISNTSRTLQWPGYEPFSKAINIETTKDGNTERISIARLANSVAKALKEFCGVSNFKTFYTILAYFSVIKSVLYTLISLILLAKRWTREIRQLEQRLSPGLVTRWSHRFPPTCLTRATLRCAKFLPACSPRKNGQHRLK